ncbi:DUF241 domain-containing protein [Quillaja saponaria]|uniref:DUF241 domain-containing protein n=1 Tax=Quillaja saponaria TaxID=32244 RepID=A0AAD7LZ04_QUISA|nr:DUF241 domain-containing protein [Quillaja saponaria]
MQISPFDFSAQKRDQRAHNLGQQPQPGDHQTSARLCDGLSRLKDVHDSLAYILLLPQTQESLRRRPDWVEKLLEDFLRFVDVYGIFQTSIMSLKEEHSTAQMAIRKRDDAKLALYIKHKTKMAKEMDKLASNVRVIRQNSTIPGSSPTFVSLGDAELADVIGDVIDATVSVSVALFSGIATSFASRKTSWIEIVRLSKNTKKVKKLATEGIKEFRQIGVESLWGLRKKGDEEVRLISKTMRDLDCCLCSIENGSERVFRALISSRVSLLNTHTQ